MKELLDNIQKLIDEYLDEDVNIQQNVLEPLFNQVYEKCRSSEVDIKDMLKISQLENQLTKRIIDVNPIIEPSTNIDENDKIIEQLIYYSRKKIEEVYNCSIKKDSLRSRSLEVSNIVLECAKTLNVAACMFNLSEYFTIPFKHYVVIAYQGGKYYLLDLTYQQFFLLGYNFKNRYYEHPSYTRVCEVGGYVVTDKSAYDMIQKGYLTNNNEIKSYFDGFMEISKSNKLESGYEYLKVLLITLKGSNDKRDKILYNNMNF